MKATLRKLKAALLQRNIVEKPVIIIASRRGGSTMVADIVAVNKGVWFVNEPFAVLPGHPNFALKQQLLPEKKHSQYFALSGIELEKFEAYVSMLLSAKDSSFGACRHVAFPFSADRVCLKILNTPWMLDWFLTQIDAHVIFLLRHPAAQATSVMRQQWGYGVSAYFEQPEILATVFSDDQISLGIDILKQKIEWKIAILDWVIGTHHGRNSQNSNLIKINYETLVLDPAPVLECFG